MMSASVQESFRRLHDGDLFVMPNPWDVGSARLLAALGFPALATTSSGHAAALGRRDQNVDRDELLVHAQALVSAVDVPISVDAESGFSGSPSGVAETVRLLGSTGAAGCSIEDYDPMSGRILPFEAAVERIAAAADSARRHGMVLTARAENHLYGTDDLDDTIARLRAYRDVGADVMYAPGPTETAVLARIVEEVDAPINVLALPGGPTVAELTSIGVQRVTTGGALAWAAYAAAVDAGRELLGPGSTTYAAARPPDELIERAFT